MEHLSKPLLHYGNRSRSLVKEYEESLGYLYLSSNNKHEFMENINQFSISELTKKPITFEIFIDSEEESDAVKNVEYSNNHIWCNLVKVNEIANSVYKTKLGYAIMSILGENGIALFRKRMRR